MAGVSAAYNPRPARAGHAPLGFGPESRVHGVLRPSGSKSLAQRALLCAAVARGTTTLEGLGAGPAQSDDVHAAHALLARAGLAHEAAGPGEVRVRGAPPGTDAGLRSAGVIEVGESGTLARLATALLALSSARGERWTIAASGSLLFRRSRPLFEALERAGVALARQNLPGPWPVELVSAAPLDELLLRDPVSSQEVSALLLALAAHAGERGLEVRGRIPSEPYLAMTLRLLADFGAVIVDEPRDGARAFAVRGPLRAPERPFVLEPDASSAAVALAAACLSGGELRVPGLSAGSFQGDVRIVAHLAALGCQARADEDGLVARGFPLRGAELELSGEPDLAPVLAAVAAGAALRHGVSSVLRGLGTLPGKESDRLSVLSEGLGRLGLSVEVGADWLAIAPGGPVAIALRPGETLVLDPRGDHRMAFAFALLGLLVPGVLVADPDCVGKSWGSFWEDLASLGAKVVRQPEAARGFS